jgi:hypothetical protein
MKWNSKSTAMKCILISRITILSSIVFLVVAAILLMVHSAIWLIGALSMIGGVLFCISLSIPGILIICRRPDLAYAWRNGRYPLAFSDTPWELLSSKQKRSVYFESMFTLFFVIVFIVWTLSEQ